MLSLKKIIILALILRLGIALLGEHGDVINYYYWSKDIFEKGFLGFYDRNIANAMRPTYPPVTSYIFYFTAGLHSFIWKIFWFLNLEFPLFPSNLIFWFESVRGWYFINKLPAIIADLGIIIVIYRMIVEIISKKAALTAAAIFAFTPVFWYNSALWGQTDSLFALPLIISFYYLLKKRPITSILYVGLSVLTKPTSWFVLPVYFLFWFKEVKLSTVIKSFILVFAEILILYLPFHPQSLIPWIITFYQHSLGGELNYMVANAFNLWALLLGFANQSQQTLFLGVPVYLIGISIYFTFLVIIFRRSLLVKKLKPRQIFLLAIIIAFAGFLFLPKIHDRYFYPTLLFMVPLYVLDKRTRIWFWLASTIHLINLYHFWWVPKIDILINIFSNNIVLKSVIILNILVFYRLFKLDEK